MTGAGFLAKREGIVKISSYRHACPATAAGSASCDALISWKVTVVVRGPQGFCRNRKRLCRNPPSSNAIVTRHRLVLERAQLPPGSWALYLTSDRLLASLAGRVLVGDGGQLVAVGIGGPDETAESQVVDVQRA